MNLRLRYKQLNLTIIRVTACELYVFVFNFDMANKLDQNGQKYTIFISSQSCQFDTTIYG